MLRLAYLAAAIAIAAAPGSVGAVAGDQEDARGEEWFWSFPAEPPIQQETDDRGTAWFWSFPTEAQKAQKPTKRDEKWFWSLGAADRETKERERTRLLIFTGVDLWRHGAFAHDGFVWTPAGAGVDGFAFKAMVWTGYYEYRAGALGNLEVTGWMAGAAVMPGAQFKREGVSVAIYAGLDLQTHRLSLFDPTNDLQGRHVGLRAMIELWAEPIPKSMVALSATWSSVGSSYAARLAAGWHTFALFYLGPEVSAYGDADYWQLRLGLHVTALETKFFGWRLEWQGGAGYVMDEDGNHGPYGRLGLLWRY
jgi:hypothetical protein